MASEQARRCEGCASWVADDADGIGQQESCECGRHCWACCDVEDGGEREGLPPEMADDAEAAMRGGSTGVR